MRSLNLSLSLFLAIIWNSINISYVDAAESFQFPEENTMLTALKAEKDPIKKENLIKELGEKCPFRESNSELGGVGQGAVSLNLSAALSNEKRAECNSYFQGFNNSLAKTRGIQGMISSTDLDEEEKISLEGKLKNAMTATSGLRSMLQAQCEFDNSDKDISAASNQISNLVEDASSTLFWVNPVAAVVGASAAAGGRLITSIGDWLFDKPQNQLTNEATDSEHFINDLCSFRDLAQKYDKLYSDPFEEKIKKEKEFEEKKKAMDKAFGESYYGRECAEQLKSSIDKLQAFSLELTAAVDRPSSQKQCLSLLNNYIDNKKKQEADPLQILAARYGCSKSLEEGHGSYCKNLKAIESMVEGDIYDKCEKEDFQKSASAKFINLSDILFRDVQEDVKKNSPVIDELQRLQEAEKSKRLALDQFNAIQSVVLDTNPITNVNTSKAMTNLGRNLLNDRFDKFAKKAFESAESDYDEAVSVLDDLVDQKKDLGEEGFFSWRKKDDVEKVKMQKEICENALQVKRQLANAYRANSGVKDICDFMKGDGIPSLKSRGFNYDNYSAPISDQSNNLSNRCVDYYKKVTSNFADIKEEMNIVVSLGCSYKI